MFSLLNTWKESYDNISYFDDTMDTCTAQLLHSVMDRGTVDSEQLLHMCRTMQLPPPQQQPSAADVLSPAAAAANHSSSEHDVIGHGINGAGQSNVPPSTSPNITTLNNMAIMQNMSSALSRPPGFDREGDLMDAKSDTGVYQSDLKKMRKVGQCKVCGDEASGMYFGAMVCVPCKTFFLRYYGDNFSFVCRNQKDCEINMKTRTQCKYCRMQKCLRVGMLRRVRPSHVQITDGQQLCVVCSDLANGLHFGAITCEGCKKFFRRGLKENPSYVCKNEKNCLINPRTRNACRYCRYQKCLKAGMCREAIQMGRPSKFRHIVHNPNLPVMKMEPGSPEDMSTMSGGAGNGAPHMGGGGGHHSRMDHQRRDPRDYGQYGTVPPPPLAMYGGASAGVPSMVGDNRHSPHHVGHTSSPPLQAAGSNHLYQALKGSGSGSSSSMLHSPPNHLSPGGGAQQMQIKSEPPDHGYNQLSPAQGYHSPVPQNALTPPMPMMQQQAPHTHPTNQSQQDQINILNITNPWSQAMKTMNQETSMLISNSLMSTEEHPGGYGNQYSPKYSNAGVTLTETTRSMTTSLSSYASGGCSMARSPPTSSTYSTFSQPSNQMEAHALTHEDLELLDSLHRALETANSSDTGLTGEMNPIDQASDQQQHHGEQNNAIEAMKAVIPTTSHNPSTMATESITSFNNFMKLSLDQLTEWVDFLQREREHTISPSNSSTLRALQSRNSSQFNPDYWLKPSLPDENVFFTEKHRKILDQITTAYTSFVEGGHSINKELTYEFYNWLRNEGYTSPEDSALVEVDDRFNSKVVEKYTICSVVYCKALPGFRTFADEDQYNIVRLGQSQSRILAAASHWYNRDSGFQYFLSWKPTHAVREYKFKESCLKFSEMVAAQDWDMIESAIMNSLVMVATDYSGLKHPEIIESVRLHILQAFRAYTTAKYGTPNTRIEELFSVIPKLRELGVLHHKWTMVHLLKQESKEASSALAAQEQVLSSNQSYQGQGQSPSRSQSQGQMTASTDQGLLL